MLLDKFMPAYDFNEVHSITIHASPERIFRAVKEVTPAEMSIFTLLTGLRALPALLTGRRGRSFSRRRPLISTALRKGFVLLAEQPDHELVVGTIGQFWRAAGGAYKVADAQEFLTANPTGYAKAVMNFVIYRKPNGTRLRTETRIHIPDPGARKRFAAYWRVIQPGSAIIRMVWLRAIKRRAERV